jgi:hypothetical protein
LALKISQFLQTALAAETHMIEELTFASTEYSAFNLVGVHKLSVPRQRERLNYFQNRCKGAGNPGTFAWTNVLAVKPK